MSFFFFHFHSLIFYFILWIGSKTNNFFLFSLTTIFKKCTATCDSVGFQSRLIHCVWNGTDSPAGLACAGNSSTPSFSSSFCCYFFFHLSLHDYVIDLPRLDVTRPCRGPPCPERKFLHNYFLQLSVSFLPFPPLKVVKILLTIVSLFNSTKNLNLLDSAVFSEGPYTCFFARTTT